MNTPDLADDTPVHDKTCTAISILQTAILASDTKLIPQKLWPGNMHMATPALEMATKLLIEVLPDVERI